MIPQSCFSKSDMRLLPADWERNNAAIWAATLAARDSTNNLRQDASTTRHLARLGTSTAYAHSSAELRDRVHEINRVREELEEHLQQVNKELRSLQDAKAVCDAECERRNDPLDVTVRCISLRERRRQTDLVKDDVETNLQKEAKTLQQSMAELGKLSLESVDKLRALQSVKEALERDLEGKATAASVDGAQAGLIHQQSLVSFKPQAPSLDTTPSAALFSASQTSGLFVGDWLENTLNNMKKAMTEINKSQNLRGRICAAIQASKIQEDHQRDATDFSLRVRHHKAEKAYRDLKWQKNELKAEAEVMEEEILRVEAELSHSGDMLRTVQTRLEERKSRPQQERVCDESLNALLAEERLLRLTREKLRDKLSQCRCSLHELQHRLREVDHDLRIKAISLEVETRVEGERDALRPPKKPSSLTETYLTLTGSLKQHPTQILK